MNLVRCGNGHFYDRDKFGANCPHCGTGGPIKNNEATVALTPGDANADVTVALDQAQGSGTLQEAVAGAMANAPTSAGIGMDDEKTVGFFHKSIGKEPVVGWLVCIDGNHFGEDFRLKTGRNFIGRSSAMDIVLSGDNTVSREKHAAIVYEPKQHFFLVQPGESKELCYLNDTVVLASQKLNIYDILTVGGSKLMFFPCCGEEFNWQMAKRDSEAVKEV